MTDTDHIGIGWMVWFDYMGTCYRSHRSPRDPAARGWSWTMFRHLSAVNLAHPHRRSISLGAASDRLARLP